MSALEYVIVKPVCVVCTWPMATLWPVKGPMAYVPAHDTCLAKRGKR